MFPRLFSDVIVKIAILDDMPRLSEIRLRGTEIRIFSFKHKQLHSLHVCYARR